MWTNTTGNPNENTSTQDGTTQTHIRTMEVMATARPRANPVALPESAYRKLLSCVVIPKCILGGNACLTSNVGVIVGIGMLLLLLPVALCPLSSAYCFSYSVISTLHERGVSSESPSLDLQVIHQKPTALQVISPVQIGWNVDLIAGDFRISSPIEDHVSTSNQQNQSIGSGEETSAVPASETGPSIVLVYPENGSIHHSSTMIDLEVSDPSGVVQVIFNWDTGGVHTLAAPYDVELAVGDGTHELFIYAQGGSGNWSAQRFGFITDDTSPTILLSNPQSGTAHRSGTIVSLTVEDQLGLAEVISSWDGNTNTTLLSPYDTALPAGDGHHTIDVYAWDMAGNQAHMTYAFTVDDTGPSITLNSPVNGTTHDPDTMVNLSIVDISGLFRVVCRWDMRTNITLVAPYNLTLPSENGPHLLHVYAQDSVGNWAVSVYVFTTVRGVLSETDMRIVQALIITLGYIAVLFAGSRCSWLSSERNEGNDG